MEPVRRWRMAFNKGNWFLSEYLLNPIATSKLYQRNDLWQVIDGHNFIVRQQNIWYFIRNVGLWLRRKNYRICGCFIVIIYLAFLSKFNSGSPPPPSPARTTNYLWIRRFPLIWVTNILCSKYFSAKITVSQHSCHSFSFLSDVTNYRTLLHFWSFISQSLTEHATTITQLSPKSFQPKNIWQYSKTL